MTVKRSLSHRRGQPSAPLEEVVPSSIGVDGGESLQATGDVRGKRRLADVLQALQLTHQNPAVKKKADFIQLHWK